MLTRRRGWRRRKASGWDAVPRRLRLIPWSLALTRVWAGIGLGRLAALGLVSLGEQGAETFDFGVAVGDFR